MIKKLFMHGFFCCSFFLSSNAFSVVTGQYLRVELLGDNKILSLAEVEVYDDQNINVALNKNAIQDSTMSAYVAGIALDGVTSTGFTHTANNFDKYHWRQLDLSSEVNISKLVIYNRASCCADRILGARILLLDGSKNLIWDYVIPTVETDYTIYVEPPVVAPLPRNILRNARFTQQTNPSVADYWGVDPQAAVSIEGWPLQYGVISNIAPPAEVPDVGVVQLSNPNIDFKYLSFMPARFLDKYPAGSYTFSFYMKADTVQQVQILQGPLSSVSGNTRLAETTLNWTRYSFTFQWNGDKPRELEPYIRPKAPGNYYIAAPQIVEGTVASVFHDAIEDSYQPVPATFTVSEKLKVAVASPASKVLSIQFEYDYFTENNAMATLEIKSDTVTSVDISCTSLNDATIWWSQSNILFNKSLKLELDISTLPLNASMAEYYSCSVMNQGLAEPVSTRFSKLPANNIEVKVNRIQRGLSLKTSAGMLPQPFHIIGMAVGNWNLRDRWPAWYFNKLVEDGFNTVIYFSRTIDNSDLDVFLARASAASLKVVVGVPLVTEKTADWNQRFSDFIIMVNNYKNNPTIIGWNIVDEPNAAGPIPWQTSELISVYNQLKAVDPYRFAFINWDANGVQDAVGVEPLGSLSSTDIYSMDYYPFTYRNRNMEGFAEKTVSALKTSQQFNKLSHSWIQLFGYGPGWREPRLQEFRYMVYMNLLYGGMYSYFSTSTSSQYTKQQLPQINFEAATLAQIIFQNKQVKEIINPQIDVQSQQNFIYSAWQGGDKCYVIVVHNGNASENFSFDTSRCFNMPVMLSSLFENNRPVNQSGLNVSEYFGPYETRVYVVQSINTDLNTDAITDINDFFILRDSLLSGDVTADINQDSMVTGIDYSLLRKQL